jgi:hypothetical protein
LQYPRQIDELEESETTINRKESTEEIATEVNENEESTSMTFDKDLQEQTTVENCILSNRKRKRRREIAKRDYNDDMLTSAINDLKLGHTLIETATKYNIPRSTLYMRAKALGIHLNASRNGYPAECMNAAITAVIG